MIVKYKYIFREMLLLRRKYAIIAIEKFVKYSDKSIGIIFINLYSNNILIFFYI